MTERGLKNINVFYSTFTNVFLIFVTFFTFFNVFYSFLERFFTSMQILNRRDLESPQPANLFALTAYRQNTL